MKVLADTHVGIWWLSDPSRLSAGAREILADSRTRIFFSAASLWEIELKRLKGKLQVPDDYWRLLRADGFEELSIRAEHILALRQLPPLHADPYDRLLLAQARLESLVLVSRNRQLFEYGLPILTA